MAPPFETSLATLERAEVLEFLQAGHEEGLTWEAKGGDDPQPKHVRKNVSGFANAYGGSLILGAAQNEGEWMLPGMVFPGGEATAWLSDVILEL